MKALLDGLVAFVALEHVWFLLLEMVFWTKPLGRKTFRLTEAQAAQTAALAANQGLYNGFLAAGLVWSLLAGPALATALKAFFLSCVAVAGVFGAFTVSRRIFYIQAVPALLGLGLLWWTR